MPTVPNLSSLVYFGTGGDAIETNRNTGGPALAVLSGVPVHSPAYVSLGGQAGMTRFDSIDTQNLRSAAVLASGWTWAVVARAPGAGNAHAVADFLTVSITSTMAINLQINARINLYVSSGVRGTIVTTKATTDWHFIALTAAGGATGVITMYDFTENITTGVPVTYTPAGLIAGNFSPRFGGISGDPAGFNNSVDVAFGMVSLSPLAAGSLASIAASVRLSMTRRGISI
jgi:hypothetical protein